MGKVGQSYGRTVLWNPICPNNTPILCVRPIQPVPCRTSGILPVPPTHSILCVHPIPPVPCKTSGTVLWNPTLPPTHSILCVRPIHLSHVGQVGQSYGILPVPPTLSILCVRPIPPVPCRTSRTVLWNPICPTNTLDPMCPSYPCCTM